MESPNRPPMKLRCPPPLLLALRRPRSGRLEGRATGEMERTAYDRASRGLTLRDAALRAAPQSRCPEEATGPTACNNEGCAGRAGAEPHAWRAGHGSGYAV